MNWGRGLLRLWVVATTLWVVGVVAVCEFLGNGYEFRGVEAVELSAAYSYYRIFHPNLLAATRQAILKLDTPLSCVTQDERDKAEAKLAKLKAEQAKRPPLPPGEIVPGKLDDLIQIGQSKEVMARPVCSEAVLREQDALRMTMQDQKAADIHDLLSAVEDGGWVPEARLSFAYWLFGPPIAVFILGASLLWALRGFRAR